jgi:hypothetical protein
MRFKSSRPDQDNFSIFNNKREGNIKKLVVVVLVVLFLLPLAQLPHFSDRKSIKIISYGIY